MYGVYMLEEKQIKADMEASVKIVFTRYGHNTQHLEDLAVFVLETTSLNSRCTHFTTLSVY
jgi:hypothetical protein